MEDPRLATWTQLNDALRAADEDTCLMLLKREKRGRRRERWLLRIHSRLNRLRAQRERLELGQKEETG